MCSPVTCMSCDLCRKCNMMELPKKHTKYLMKNTHDKESWCSFLSNVWHQRNVLDKIQLAFIVVLYKCYESSSDLFYALMFIHTMTTNPFI